MQAAQAELREQREAHRRELTTLRSAAAAAATEAEADVAGLLATLQQLQAERALLVEQLRGAAQAGQEANEEGLSAQAELRGTPLPSAAARPPNPMSTAASCPPRCTALCNLRVSDLRPPARPARR